MTVAELIKHLQTLDQSLPVYIGQWHDMHPDGFDATDLSCYEPIAMKTDQIEVRDNNHGWDVHVKEKHVYIDPGMHY